MIKIRKSPFKVDKIEDDPHAFGNRPKEVITCVESLFNNRHILISGPRGIGKSSLAYQIQNLYKGKLTLAKRCKIETKLEKYLTCFYTCGKSTTLDSFALDLIFRIENNCKWVKTFKTGSKKRFEASLDLKIIKASLQTDIITSKPASIATQLVNGLNIIYKSLINFTNYNGIIILIDELDHIDEKINFGHFLKTIHEYFIQDGLININFIFVGQKGIFSHLYTQDASIERIIQHVPISKLESDECIHILNYASSKKAEPPFTIEPEAEELILKLSSGFPYVIQLLGDSAFSAMTDLNRMLLKDVTYGVEKILKSDKNEKYYSIFNSISTDQRILITIIANYNSSELPMIIPFGYIFSEAKMSIRDEEKIQNILDSLGKEGYLIINGEKKVCQFNDELFRIFLALIYLEEKDKMYEEGKIEFISFSDPKIKEIVNQIEKATYRDPWEFD